MPKQKPQGPKPKPGDKPKDGKQPAPKPKIVPGAPKAAGPPAKFKHMLTKKAGFANYYFNTVEQNRLKPFVDDWGDYSSLTGTWKIKGKSADGKPFTLTLADKGLGLDLGGEPYLQSLDGSDFIDEPKGSGGMLVAFQQLKHMLTAGDQGFSEYYYLGSEPLDVDTTVDVIVTSKGGVEGRWYFAQEPAAFVGFSSQLYEDSDECEVLFGSLADFEGRKFPKELTVRVGSTEFVKLIVESVVANTK
jgi:hypothetical protein